jgi:hypothetical protein
MAPRHVAWSTPLLQMHTTFTNILHRNGFAVQSTSAGKNFLDQTLGLFLITSDNPQGIVGVKFNQTTNKIVIHNSKWMWVKMEDLGDHRC